VSAVSVIGFARICDSVIGAVLIVTLRYF